VEKHRGAVENPFIRAKIDVALNFVLFLKPPLKAILPSYMPGSQKLLHKRAGQ
jgi:hypothetical protein